MAFTIKFRHSNGAMKYDTWHIQSKKPEYDYRQFRVEQLAADGDELEMIRVRIKNIPITKGGICIWRDELAQFIYDNL